MASLPSLLARGYLRSRCIPRIPTTALRFQHVPSTFPQRTAAPLDGPVDLFPSTRISPIADIKGNPLDSNGRKGDSVERPKVTTSSGLEKNLKVRPARHLIVDPLDSSTASRCSVPHHQRTLARIPAHPSANVSSSSVTTKRSQGRQGRLLERKDRSRKVSLLLISPHTRI